MTVPVMQFEAKKHGYRQTQDGIVVSFVVHPNDVNADLAVAPLGTHYVVVVAPYTETAGVAQQEERPQDAAGSSPAAGTTPRERRRFADMPRSQQAALMCNDARFLAWIEADTPAEAATYVRVQCRVESRAHLDSNLEGAALWDHLRARYLTETGQLAEPRG